jgi:hypothetical protein
MVFFRTTVFSAYTNEVELSVEQDGHFGDFHRLHILSNTRIRCENNVAKWQTTVERRSGRYDMSRDIFCELALDIATRQACRVLKVYETPGSVMWNVAYEDLALTAGLKLVGPVIPMGRLIEMRGVEPLPPQVINLPVRRRA